MRFLIVLLILTSLLVAHTYWFWKLWRFAGRMRVKTLRGVAQAVSGFAYALVILLVLTAGFTARRDALWQHAGLVGTVGWWVTSAFLAFVLVQVVTLIGWIVRPVSRLWTSLGDDSPADLDDDLVAEQSTVDLSRRGFLHTTTMVAGALPFAFWGYGYLIGRRRYHVREVTLPVHEWLAGLDGLRVVQLSDVHCGAYMPVDEVRRIVGMANELKADLAVVTGDFLTGAGDPLEGCIRELSALRAPLGVWGCNGNHEIYADAEAAAAQLFARYGMTLLRQENVELVRHAQAFNLIGVDYQRPAYDRDAPAGGMLVGIEPLVRRDVPNILLSHNPNAFPRAAELGIELTLSGHTHGGQVRFELLDPRISPARFLTNYVAGTFKRPLGAAASLEDAQAFSGKDAGRGTSLLYVNTGLGTIFAPVRLGVPPEISIFTLQRA
jgi:predicted MPP superfamily phosphohydrolase